MYACFVDFVFLCLPGWCLPIYSPLSNYFTAARTQLVIKTLSYCTNTSYNGIWGGGGGGVKRILHPLGKIVPACLIVRIIWSHTTVCKSHEMCSVSKCTCMLIRVGLGRHCEYMLGWLGNCIWGSNRTVMSTHPLQV